MAGGRSAVLLDLDDTCFDQSRYLVGAWSAVADRAGELGADATAILVALLDAAEAGSDGGGIIDRAVVAAGADVPISELVEAFRRYRPPQLEPYPGLVAGLQQLRQLTSVGLVTNGEPGGQQAKIEALGLEGYFDAVVMADSLGRHHRKPDPAPFLLALELLGAEAAQSFYVGDHPVRDVFGAQGVGMRAVRVMTGEHAGRPDVVTPWRRCREVASAIELLSAELASQLPGNRGLCGTPRSSLDIRKRKA